MNGRKRLLPIVIIGMCVLSGRALAGWTTVKTPNGTTVDVETRMEFTDSEIAYNDKLATDAFPLATLVRSSSNRVNCHSYAWHSQSPTNYYWMHDPEDYWKDGSFVRTTPSLTPVDGRILYPKVLGFHSAYVSHGVEDVTSTWGELPTMRHSPSHSPYNSSTLYYYTRSSVCPFGTGDYCGDPLRGQDPNYLYSCWSGTYNLTIKCKNGCRRMGPGYDDKCQ